jgi:3-oxoacyl-[acyl-carrier protein] reductase
LYPNGIDYLVNNAGITVDKLLLRTTDEELERIMNVNLTSAMKITRLVVKSMIRNRLQGSIVNVSSYVGLHGNSGQTAYAASKAGLIGTILFYFSSRVY